MRTDVWVWSEKELTNLVRLLLKQQPGSTTINVFTKKLVKQEKMPKGIIAGFFGYISDKDNYQFIKIPQRVLNLQMLILK